MSHFVVLVLTEDGVLSTVRTLLSPYNEWTQVEPYKVYEYVNWPDGEDEHGPYGFSTDNPNVKYDWCEVGGRWDGALFGVEWRDANLTEDHERLENNQRPVSELLEEDELFVPAALVTPDGEWHTSSKQWYDEGYEELREKEWKPEVKALYEQYPDCIATLIDCHV